MHEELFPSIASSADRLAYVEDWVFFPETILSAAHRQKRIYRAHRNASLVINNGHKAVAALHYIGRARSNDLAGRFTALAPPCLLLYPGKGIDV